jgi:hypothetical protein
MPLGKRAVQVTPMALRQAMLLGRLASDTVDAFDRDQIILHDVYDSVLAGPQPVIVAAVEGFRRVRVLS